MGKLCTTPGVLFTLMHYHESGITGPTTLSYHRNGCTRQVYLQDT